MPNMAILVLCLGPSRAGAYGTLRGTGTGCWSGCQSCVSVVAECVDDVEAVGVVDAEAEGVAKLDHGVLADVEVVVVVDAGGDGVEG